MLDDALLFNVTDLKQYSYCGRVVFYERCLPHLRPITFKMEAGLDEHEVEQKRATRRNLSQYDLPGGRREFDVRLSDPTLRLSGLVDEVVYTPDGELFAVDYKLTDKVSQNHKVQLTAYTLLLEANTGQRIRRGFVYLIKPRRLVEVAITPALRAGVQTFLDEMIEMIAQERFPPPPATLNRCVDCEFRRFCNDVL